MGFIAVHLTFILLWAVSRVPVAGGATCFPQSDSWIIADEDEALSLASAIGCSDGNFTVTWVGAITVSQTLTIADGTSLTITGEGTDSAMDGAGTAGPLLFVEGDSSSLTLRNLEITRGSGTKGGAIYALTSTTVNIINCTFSDNDASGSGGNISYMRQNTLLTIRSPGAIYTAEGVTLHIDGYSTFYQNTAYGSGGAIHAEISSSVELAGTTTFTANSAGLGGAIYIVDTVNLTVNGVSRFFSNSANEGGAIYEEESSLAAVQGVANFTGNKASSQGGAITAYGSLTLLSISGEAFFSGNSAVQEGGALRITEDASLDINGQAVVFVNNTAGIHGGAISMFSSDESAVINIEGESEFTKNSAGTNGGAVYVDAAKSVFVTGVRKLEENSARGGFGGGLYVARVPSVEVTSSSFAFNSATFGGAIASFSSGLALDSILYSDCTFTENSAEEDGGAIYSVASYDDLRNVVMDGNFAGGSGGALVHSGEMSALIDVTFSNNLAGGDGPAVLSLGAIVEMANCTFTGNSFFCEPGTYLEDVEEGCRLNVVCWSCFVECVTSVATVENENFVPSCTEAPEHTTTLEAGGTVASLVLEKGFYRASSESLSILECFNEDACVGGSVAGKYCAEGYTGPYCAVCMEDYASGYSYSCKACWKRSSQVINAVLIIGLAVFILLLIVVIQYLTAKIPPAEGDSGHEFPALEMDRSALWVRSATKHLVGTLKIVLVVWQITTQFTSITGTVYSGVYQDFIEGIGVLDLDRGLILSSSCLMESNFYDRLLLSTCLPFVAVFILVITRFIALNRNNRLPRVVAEIDNRHLSILLVVVLLIYSTTSTTIFETFACDPLDDGVDYLRADYRLKCNTREHRFYQVFAGVMIVVYPIGIPLCLGWWLFMNRHALREQSRPEQASERLAPFTELWEPYKPERYYWEIVEFIRRVLLTGIGVFIFPNSAAQIAVILLLAAFFGVVFEVLNPYRDSRDTWLYRMGYVVVLLSVYLALLLRVDVSNDRSPSQDVFSILLIAVHCMMILAVVTEGLGLASDACRKMRAV